MAEPVEPSRDWGVELRVPTGWAEIDPTLPVEDRRRRLVESVDAIVADVAGLEGAQTWMLHVAESVVSNRALERALVAALGFAPAPPVGIVAMNLMGCPLFLDTPPNLDALEDELRPARPNELGERDVTRVRLPAGPAVRVHAVVHAPTDEGERMHALESVDYYIPVTGSTDVLLLACTTPSLTVGEQAVEIFDSIAQTITFDHIEIP